MKECVQDVCVKEGMLSSLVLLNIGFVGTGDWVRDGKGISELDYLIQMEKMTFQSHFWDHQRQSVSGKIY